MEYLIIVILSIILIVFLKEIFSIKIKNIKAYKEDEKLIEISDKFPDNIEIAKEMLTKLNNENVKIVENPNSETSLYIALTNTISISNVKRSSARIQTIAHECLHSIQSRKLLLANFIFSNIYIIYFFAISILTIFKITKNPLMYVSILVILSLVKFTIRAFLEIDAMTKAKYLAKEYIEGKNICTSEEIDDLVSEYEKINSMGIPFVTWNLAMSNIIKVVIYAVISMIVAL